MRSIVRDSPERIPNSSLELFSPVCSYFHTAEPAVEGGQGPVAHLHLTWALLLPSQRSLFGGKREKIRRLADDSIKQSPGRRTEGDQIQKKTITRHTQPTGDLLMMSNGSVPLLLFLASSSRERGINLQI